MEKKILLIDGHSILNRAFYGVPDLTNSEGIHTNALFGFLNIMFRFLQIFFGQEWRNGRRSGLKIHRW